MRLALSYWLRWLADVTFGAIVAIIAMIVVLLLLRSLGVLS